MRFTLHGGSDEEVEALREFAEQLGVSVSAYAGMPGEEPLLVVQCFPRQVGLMEVLGRITRWLDGGPPTTKGAGVQEPLPGVETPPCR